MPFTRALAPSMGASAVIMVRYASIARVIGAARPPILLITRAIALLRMRFLSIMGASHTRRADAAPVVAETGLVIGRIAPVKCRPGLIIDAANPVTSGRLFVMRGTVSVVPATVSIR